MRLFEKMRGDGNGECSPLGEQVKVCCLLENLRAS